MILYTHSDTITNIDDIEEERDIEMVHFTDIFDENVSSDEFNYSLPKQKRYATHTLNLVATNVNI
jgi:hypothetical protein